MKVRDITITAMFTALGVIVPIIFHSVEMFGRIFLPMHITVILAAMLTGPYFGGICAVLTVLISSFVTGMPPIYPTGLIMVFELAAYALVSGFTLRLLHNKTKIIINLYISLISAMILGRIVLGVFSVIFIGMLGNGYSLAAFISSAFVTALPGIIIQLVIIPWLIFFIRKNNIFLTEM